MSLKTYANPARMADALKRRGVRGAAYHALRRWGSSHDKALVGPDFVRINPMGAVCNHTCPMCWLQQHTADELKAMHKDDREKGLRIDDYRRIFDEMPPGVEEINIVGGGEPLIHPDIIEIFREVKRHGWRGSLITNGTLLKEEIARAMVDLQWETLRVSVHAGDRETYRAVQGVDRYATLIENLKIYDRLRRERGLHDRCELRVLHVIQRANLNSIDKLFHFAETVGADFITFEKLIELDNEMTMSADEYARAHDDLASAAQRSDVPCNLAEALSQLERSETARREGKPFIPARSCSVGFDQMLIGAMGEVLPCCFSNEIMGNVRERSIRDIWFGEAYAEFRNRLIAGKFSGYCISNRCAIKAVLHD